MMTSRQAVGKRRFLVCDMSVIAQANGMSAQACGMGISILNSLGVDLFVVDRENNTNIAYDALKIKHRLHRLFKVVLGSECTFGDSIAEFARSNCLPIREFCAQAVFVSVNPEIMRVAVLHGQICSDMFLVGMTKDRITRMELLGVGAYHVIDDFTSLADLFLPDVA